LRRHQSLTVWASTVSGAPIYTLDRQTTRVHAQERRFKVSLQILIREEVLDVAAAAARFFRSTIPVRVAPKSGEETVRDLHVQLPRECRAGEDSDGQLHFEYHLQLLVVSLLDETAVL
jgi:hypothetical protein